MSHSSPSPLRRPIAAAAVALLAACSDRGSSGGPPDPGYVEVREPCASHDPQRQAYFGDLHVHTTYSFDANAFDVRVTPEQAYRFARGEAVALPPLDSSGQGTRSVRLERPLDFVAVTDHSEFLGEIEACTTPGSEVYDFETCRQLRDGDSTRAVGTFGIRLTPPSPTRFPDLCGDDGQGCRGAAGEVWARVQSAADGAYDRSSRCTLTAFVAYEYTGATNVSNYHRNVIFRNDRVPFPTSYFEQPTPQGLWRELRAGCTEAGTGCDVLAIPHNSNESNGHMFFVEYPGATTPEEERRQAEQRARMEPLIEIFQHKGDSECRNGLSGVLGEPDEQCEFEKWTRPGLQDCGDTPGVGGVANYGCYSRLDFARGALLEGLREADRIGANPYALGIIASTDTHNAIPGYVEEDTFVGHRGVDDDTPERQLGPGLLTAGGIAYDPGGLAGVWAEENSRPAIFDALRRRETFGTSGPRIVPRFFGGFGLDASLCDDPDLVGKGYAQGVPMGGTLDGGAAPGAPSFVVSALRDPGTASRRGTLLQRAQIVKGWVDPATGERHQKVYDVAGDPSNGATVDLETCEPEGPGFDSLCAVWTDPDFSADERAFYYARVLENPTCRWSTWACNRLDPQSRPSTCDEPGQTEPTLQERAWTSPIWYDPPRG